MIRVSTKIKVFSFLSFFVLLNHITTAQIDLPYYTGFDNDTEQDGWTEYKTASTEFSHWGYGGTGNSFSDPSSIGHDYSPSTGITLTDNWYVSPEFSIESGGTLDSIRYMFSGFSVPEAGDTVALYLLTGSQDPELAISTTLLFDFRGDDYNSDFTYRLLTDINLMPTSEPAFLAIRYRNTDCSSKWLTVNFDNVAISGNNTDGLPVLNANFDKVNVYPNPSSGEFYMDTKSNINSLKIYNSNGEIVYSKFDSEPLERITISDFKTGIYFMNYTIGTKSYSEKIVVI